jgi:hypothetical protein
MNEQYGRALTEAANHLGLPAFIEGESSAERNHRIRTAARRRDRRLFRWLKQELSAQVDQLHGPSNLI